MASLRELIVRFTAQTASFQGEVKKVNRSLKSIDQSAKFVKRSFIALGGAFVAQNIIRDTIRVAQRFEGLNAGLRAVTNTAADANNALAFIRQESNRLGLDLLDTGDAFKKLTAASRGTSLEGEKTKQIFTAIAEASTVMRLSSEQTNGALTAIEQIISKGKVSAEELRGQLGERLPGAFQIAARAMGKTTMELDKMLKDGQLMSDVFLPKFAAEVRRTYAKGVPEAVKSSVAEVNRLKNAFAEIAIAIGQSGLLSIVAEFSKTLVTGIGNSLEGLGELLLTADKLKTKFLLPEFGMVGKDLDRVRQLRKDIVFWQDMANESYQDYLRLQEQGNENSIIFLENAEEYNAKIREMEKEIEKLVSKGDPLSELGERLANVGKNIQSGLAAGTGAGAGGGGVAGNIEQQVTELEALYKRAAESSNEWLQSTIHLKEQYAPLSSELQRALESLRTPLENLHTQIGLQHELFSQGILDLDEYTRRLGVLNEQYQKSIEGGNAAADSFANLGDSINNNIASSIGNMAVNLDSAGDAVKSLGKGIISQLITAMIKMAITGKAVQTATTAASVANAATTAIAWAPAAAAVNAATFGGGAAAGSTGLTSIAALSQSLFAVPAVAETGTDRVKRTGLSLIHKDEIIGTAEQNTKLDKAIALMNKSGGGKPVNITINVNSEGVIDEEATERFVKKIERVLITTVQGVYDQRGRSAFGPEGA